MRALIATVVLALGLALVRPCAADCLDGKGSEAYESGLVFFERWSREHLSEHDLTLMAALFSTADKEECSRAAWYLSAIYSLRYAYWLERRDLVSRDYYAEKANFYFLRSVELRGESAEFDYALFVLDRKTNFFDQNKGVALMERLGEKGDRKSIDYLAAMYAGQIPGLKGDRKKLEYWRQKLRRGSENQPGIAT